MVGVLEWSELNLHNSLQPLLNLFFYYQSLKHEFEESARVHLAAGTSCAVLNGSVSGDW